MTGVGDRVVWDEGMMLSPQHFQQWERWLHGELQGRSGAGGGFPFGFRALELDRQALAGGTLAVVHCAGLLPGGTVFRCPEADSLPPARNAAERMGPNQTSLLAHLALARPAAGAASYSDRAPLAPFERRRLTVTDLARPESTREIVTARLRLELRFEGENLDGYETLPIARLVRGPTGGLELADDFMPPATAIAAAPLLVSVLRQATGMLGQKWTELAGKRRGGGGLAEAQGILLLHTLGGSLPVLKHCLSHPNIAPEAAYVELARLTGLLCTFHPRLGATEIPAYVHEAAGPGLRRLGTMLQELLGDAAPTRCTEIPLQRDGDSMYWAKIPSPDLLTGGRLYLSARAEAPETEVQVRLATLLKISSRDRIHDLLIRAVPGLLLRVVPQPPAAIPVQPGRSYFVFEPVGEHWDAIQQSLTLAFHVSPGLDRLHLELLAVKE